MFQRILTLWDGSDVSERALSAALDLASKYDAEVLATSVVAPGEPTPLESLFAERHGSHGGVALSHEVIEGRNPSEDLLAYAHEHAFDLLVVGHHHHPKPGVLVLHGVTEHVISDADLPVLVVGG